MRHFRTPLAVDLKADASPVTRADREIETVMRAMIGQAFPGHGIIGEEFGAENAGAEYVWVLDPIDGTRGFIAGKPLFGTLIAVVRGGNPIVGVIDAPAMNDRWIGADGRATTFNGSPVATRACANLADAWLYATTPQMFQADDFHCFETLRGQVHDTGYGADCYAYGLLANGHIDLVCEASLQVYDFAALVPVVTGAGGIMADWSGAPLTLASDGRVVAAGDTRLLAGALDHLAIQRPET